MTISANYEKYLSHFSETVTLDEFQRNSSVPALVALRHDVDHDLDLALEMAHFEYARGFRSTYFILPSAGYWRTDARLTDKCLQLQDYGHEVGLHVNLLAEWVSGETDDIAASLRGQLATLRNAGVRVRGVAAHGDKRCYEHHLCNYWCFEELRPADPYSAENGRTAEGPYEVDLTPRLLYPPDHVARRYDGARLDLWSIHMRDFGLDYHAWHTKFDRYFSDSSGGWKRTPDPMNSARGNERWQILMHAEHWRGPKRYYFFLSSARSGSKWLSEVLCAATPIRTRHEHILNQPFHRGETTHKATADVWSLEDNAEEVNSRLTEAWNEFESQPSDFAEVNVYLEDFSDKLKRAFPNATYVQLKRDPRLVISSLMDRNWYDTPKDRAHPRLIHADVQSLNQLERICRYVIQVDARLGQLCPVRFDLEEISKDPSVLASKLASLGIAYHPRLGKEAFGRIVNARKQAFTSDERAWLYSQRLFMHLTFLGYGHLLLKKAWNKAISLIGKARYSIYRLDSKTAKSIKGKCAKVDYDQTLGRLSITPDAGNSNALISIGGSGWYETKTVRFRRTGWKTRAGFYVEGVMVFENFSNLSCRVYAVHYDSYGKAIYRKNLGSVDQNEGRVEFAFGAHPVATTIDLILYNPGESKASVFYLTDCVLDWVH